MRPAQRRTTLADILAGNQTIRACRGPPSPGAPPCIPNAGSTAHAENLSEPRRGGCQELDTGIPGYRQPQSVFAGNRALNSFAPGASMLCICLTFVCSRGKSLNITNKIAGAVTMI